MPVSKSFFYQTDFLKQKLHFSNNYTRKIEFFPFLWIIFNWWIKRQFNWGLKIQFLVVQFSMDLENLLHFRSLKKETRRKQGEKVSLSYFPWNGNHVLTDVYCFCKVLKALYIDDTFFFFLSLYPPLARHFLYFPPFYSFSVTLSWSFVTCFSLYFLLLCFELEKDLRFSKLHNPFYIFSQLMVIKTAYRRITAVEWIKILSTSIISSHYSKLVAVYRCMQFLFAGF